MPIRIDSDLPAYATLEQENIFVMTGERASAQDIRPLEIAIVNLMPTKEVTETQLFRMLSNTPLQINISLVQIEGHVSKNTSNAHLSRFYISSQDIFDKKFDGMIITGAPVEQLPFEQVDYWDELCRIMDYAHRNVFSTLYICWGAMAGLYHQYGIPKHEVSRKFSGVYHSRLIVPTEPLLRGFDDFFPVFPEADILVNCQKLIITFLFQFIDHSLDLCISAGSTDNGSAFSCEKLHRSCTQTLTGTGQQNYFSVKSSHFYLHFQFKYPRAISLTISAHESILRIRLAALDTVLIPASISPLSIPS